jgi:hypothetical protein
MEKANKGNERTGHNYQTGSDYGLGRVTGAGTIYDSRGKKNR